MSNLIPFKTFEEQIEILKGKNLTIENVDSAIQRLKSDNYYNIINGYKKIFLDFNNTSQSAEKFKNGATFEKIYSLYTFDRNLRNILLCGTILIENSLKTQISYVFSKYHNTLNYLQYENFETLVHVNDAGTADTETSQAKQAAKIHSLISKINSEISKYTSKHDYIKHHIVKNGYIPFWILINSLSIGTVSTFYQLMKQSERVEISKHWNVKESHLKTFIDTVSFYRNLCAHDERLYCTKSKHQINNTTIHKRLNINTDDKNGKIFGKDDIFSLLIVMKFLMLPDDFLKVFNKIRGQIESLKTKISPTDMSKVLLEMGFPQNWTILKDIKLEDLK